jgi:hypothetical protein
LDEVTGAFDQLRESVTQNIMTFASIQKTGGKGASAQTMISQLTKDVGRSVEFHQAMDALKGRGLDSTLIGQIANAGPEEGLRTARSLLQATPEQLAQMNLLQGQLKTAADKTGLLAANSMYGAGKAAAQGMVDGIQANIDAINKIMKQIADAMSLAIRQALGIKSPSKVFHGFGVNIMEGLINGLLAQGSNAPETVQNLVGAIHDKMKAVTGNGGLHLGQSEWFKALVDKVRSGNATPQDKAEFVKKLIEEARLKGKTETSTTGTSTSNSGTISQTNSSGGGDIHIGSIHVRVDGGEWDLTKSTDRQALAKALVNEIMDEIREQNKKRK